MPDSRAAGVVVERKVTGPPALFDVWLRRWSDLVDFEVYPVIKSDEAAERVNIAW
jgi:hypothetical protein